MKIIVLAVLAAFWALIAWGMWRDENKVVGLTMFAGLIAFLTLMFVEYRW